MANKKRIKVNTNDLFNERIKKCLNIYGGQEVYNKYQLNEIELGIKADLESQKVELYANPMHPSKEMGILRTAIIHGCSKEDLKNFIKTNYPYTTLDEKKRVKRLLDNILPYAQILLNMEHKVYDEEHIQLYCIARAVGLNETQRSLIMHPCASLKDAKRLLAYFELGYSFEDLKALYLEPVNPWDEK